MKLYIKVAIFVVLVIAISGILYALILFNKKHPDTAKVKPDFVLTSVVLQKEFEDNEKSASSKYINKILEVTGTINSVSADSSHLNISLKSASDISSVICSLPAISDASKFKTGEEITLRGECSGFLMDVLLKNCSLITSRK